MRQFYIIPGFEHIGLMPEYISLAELVIGYGFEPKILQVTWKRKTLTDWITETEAQVNTDEEECWRFGFSFGAMIATLLAARRPVSVLLLASLSPYFAENLVEIPEWWKKSLGKKRVVDFEHYLLEELAPSIKAPTWLFLGEQEIERYPIMKKQSGLAQQLFPNNRAILVPEAGHDIGHPHYLSAIEQALTQEA